MSYAHGTDLHSFPTRRSSDLTDPCRGLVVLVEDQGKKHALLVDELLGQMQAVVKSLHLAEQLVHQQRDRKSTRLNSSHTVISYAVFCLKKKNDSEHRR